MLRFDFDDIWDRSMWQQNRSQMCIHILAFTTSDWSRLRLIQILPFLFFSLLSKNKLIKLLEP